jgi:hypothetical protein
MDLALHFLFAEGTSENMKAMSSVRGNPRQDLFRAVERCYGTKRKGQWVITSAARRKHSFLNTQLYLLLTPLSRASLNRLMFLLVFRKSMIHLVRMGHRISGYLPK